MGLSAKELAEIFGQNQLVAGAWRVGGTMSWSYRGNTLSIDPLNGLQVKNTLGQDLFSLDMDGNVAGNFLTNLRISPSQIDGAAGGQHGIYLETFEDELAGWTYLVQADTPTFPPHGQAGGIVVQCDGEFQAVSQKKIPFDPGKKYRISARVKRVTASGTISVGVVGYAADRVTKVNLSGSDSFSDPYYNCAYQETPDADTWTLYTGWFKGTSGSPTQDVGTVGSPKTLHTNVRYISPIFVLNGGGTSASHEIDEISIDISDDLSDDAVDAAVLDVTQDDVPNGSTYHRVLGSDISSGHISLIAGYSSDLYGALYRTFHEFFEDPQSDIVTRWPSYSGSGESSIQSGGLTGGKFWRIGNNSDDDMRWAIFHKSIPYDESKLYRLRCRVRQTAGSGTCYVGVAGRNAADDAWVNKIGEDAWSNHFYLAAKQASPGSSWVEYTGYFKGRSASPDGNVHADPDDPGALHDDVRYFRPMIIVNYSSQAGTYEVDEFSVDVIPEDMDQIANGTYGKVLTTDIDAGHIKLSECIGSLDNIDDGTYGKVLTTDISAGHIKLSEVVEDATYKKFLATERTKLTGIESGADVTSAHSQAVAWLTDAGALAVGDDLDDVPNGTTYARVLTTNISAGKILLAQSDFTGFDLDDISNGPYYGKVLLTNISAGKILLAQSDFTDFTQDDVPDGATYARVLATDISAGHIKLSEATGDIDDLDDGTTYAKVLSTDISAGRIKLMKTAEIGGRVEIDPTNGLRLYSASELTAQLAPDGTVRAGHIYDIGFGAYKTDVYLIGGGAGPGSLFAVDLDEEEILMAAHGSLHRVTVTGSLKIKKSSHDDGDLEMESNVIIDNEQENFRFPYQSGSASTPTLNNNNACIYWATGTSTMHLFYRDSVGTYYAVQLT